jgi:hypothetical protein
VTCSLRHLGVAAELIPGKVHGVEDETPESSGAAAADVADADGVASAAQDEAAGSEPASMRRLRSFRRLRGTSTRLCRPAG